MKMFQSDFDRTAADKYLKTLITCCKKTKECPHCGYINGNVKKHPGALKILHDREDFYSNIDPEYVPASTGKYLEELNPLIALNLFEKMITEDVELLDMKNGISHPKNLILKHIPVPPVCIRPSVAVS
jgi:DNA-directed RNA polymerase III subunit RPC1